MALGLVARELGIGAIVGLGLTFIGVKLANWCYKKGWWSDIWKQILVVALALACFATAQSLHGSGYIAAFVGGLLFGWLAGRHTHDLVFAAEGIGEVLTPVALPERWYLVIHPGCEVSTRTVFAHPELTRNSPAITIAAFFAGDTRNDCENLVRRLAEPVDKALIWLQKFGNSALTGTGACVFASFASEQEARAAHSEVPGEWQAFVARGLNHSPALDML